MRRLPGWWLVRQLWRLGLLVAGVVLLVVSLRGVTDGSTSWWVFGIGAAAGTCIAGVALYWPRRFGRLFSKDPRSGPRDDGLEIQFFVLAVGVALTIVVVLIGRYGAALGAFAVMTGVYLVESFRRQWREARKPGSDRRRGGSGK